MTPTASYLAELCRLYILLVLVAAATGKAVALREFAATITDLFRLSPRWAGAGAVALVGAEALVALLLLAGGEWTRGGMAAALLLFIAFTAAIFFALVQRRAIICNCFGARGHPISAWDLVRNAALIAACGAYLRLGPSGHSLDATAWLLLGGLALIAALVSTGLDDIARLAR
jgi:hypothetical protein